MFSVFFIALALAADAFAVSVANGIAMKEYKIKYSLIFGFYFGFFQFFMPVIGYYIGQTFTMLIQQWSPWLAFVLLSLIGVKMIMESLREEDQASNDTVDGIFSVKNMSALAAATSIDALAAGVNFALMRTPLLSAAAMIGVVTFILSALGVLIGKKAGGFFQKGAERIGGVILIIIGLRILIESLLA
jgi:putative Mn2+ efflux pump MntP